MKLSTLDWSIICAYFLLSLAVGLWASRKAGKDTTTFFLAGRNMPWWLLGVSMVATTFSTDTPNLVTDLVRQNGIFTWIVEIFRQICFWDDEKVSVQIFR